MSVTLFFNRYASKGLILRSGAVLHVILVVVLGAFFSAVGADSFALAQSSENTAGDALPLVTGARVAGDGERTRFILDMDEQVDFTISGLANPDRLILDLPEVVFDFKDDVIGDGRGLISAWRYGLFAPGKSRIVLDVSNPIAVDRTFFLPSVDGQPSRLVIDLVQTSRKEFNEYAKLSREKLVKNQAAPKGDRLNKDTADTRPVIVIDPGHGGLDTGAEGVNGTPEKVIVLDVAKLLKESLEREGRYKVYLTREDDTFVSLRRRVELGHDWDADLFISIHADSVKSSRDKVRGATVYTLSETASDDLAQALAETENMSDIIAGVELEAETTEVTDILIDLARRETRNFSSHFARTLVAELKSAVKLIKNPLRSASFIVLKSHDVPSVLLELGYLSNEFDEKLLVSDDWRERMVVAITEAIDGFFRPRILKDEANAVQ
ncbi:MAG: N-acetylmuramoyl-L-alanine amidase [Rhodobacteraceae bacterium]|nr:N-acetylmuramoyl-L-alanine amidase [Paracoccaceae bacterium]